MRPRIAIVGTGIAGLGCAHLLRRHADLTLFEKGDHVGGHTNTVEVTEPGTGRILPVDTGFMVFNKVTYPLLTRLFGELGVPVKPTDMSFSVSDARSGFEYRGSGANTLFARRRSLLSPRYWRFLFAIDRFNRDAARDRDDPGTEALTLAEYAARGGYGDDFLERYLIPMTSAVWSTPPELMLKFPAATLIRFFHNHGFLGLHTQHPWYTVDGGAKRYVEAILRGLDPGAREVLGGVVAVTRDASGASVRTGDGVVRRFDKVVIATHADEALALLEKPDSRESALLGEFRYRDNEVVLHTDASMLPRRKLARAAWNYAIRREADGSVVNATHYWMNRLQGVSDREDYLVTVNPPPSLDRSKILGSFAYAHPMFTLGAVNAQKELPSLNRVSPDQPVYFAGSYFRYGFHEDAFMAGVDVARCVLGREPW